MRIRTGSRIHFGLIDPPAAWGRPFGGAGVMVDDPGSEIVASAADRLTVDGPLAARVKAFAESVRAGDVEPNGAHIEIVRSPLDHVGLGTGTQLGLAVAAALTTLRGESLSALELAHRVGRGNRSAIGIHGFEHGGFLVDGGKGKPDEVAPLISRFPVPEEWRFLLVVPGNLRGLSGAREKEAFRELSPDKPSSDALCRILVLGVLPALANADFTAFGEALTEYCATAAEFFRGVQGDIYASPLLEKIVIAVTEAGAAAAGQSSWGPTTFAVASDEEQANFIAEALRRRFEFSSAEVIVTRARNRGAEVTP